MPLFKPEEVAEWLEKHGAVRTELHSELSIEFAVWFASMLGQDLLEVLARRHKVQPITAEQLALVTMAVGTLRYVEQQMVDDLATKADPPKHSFLCRDLGGGMWNCEADCPVRSSK